MEKALESRLSVENIRLRAKHGWYEEERILGGWYRIDVHFQRKVGEEQSFDDLSSTVNYELIQERVRAVMAQEHSLIEHACKAVFDSLRQLSGDGRWSVELTKEHPPIAHMGETKFKVSG